MIKNYIKIAWRNMQKKKLHTLINLVGLVSSMAFILLIVSYILQMYQVNSGLRHGDRQYVLQSEYKKTGIGLDLTTVGALPKALKEEYPHLVANYYRLDGLTCIVSNGTTVYEESVALGDPTFLDMFGFGLFAGDSHTALKDPFSVVLTGPAAIKYFGKTDIVGEKLTIRNFSGEKHDFSITGVVKPTTQNSVMELTLALKSTIFLPIASQKYFDRDIDSWNNLWVAGFIELQENIKPEQLNYPIQTLLTKHVEKQIADNLTPKLEPLSSYYLHDNKGAIKQLINILIWIAVFLLIMAVVNFINFSVSQSFTRLKEIGVRKMMGSSKMQLILQLTMEYILIVFIAGLIALGAYPILAPLFDSIMMSTLPPLQELPLFFFAYFILAVLCLGILSGIYPAIKLSQNKLLPALKNQLSNTKQKHLLRRVLLFIQFVVTIVVLISSFIIARQVDIFMQTDLGYDKDYLLTIQPPRDWSEKGLHKMETVREQLRSLPQVENVSLSYGVPGSFADGVQQIQKTDNEEQVDALTIASDADFSKTYDIPLLAGSFFGNQAGTEAETDKLVISRRAAYALGFQTPEEAIGQNLSLFNNQHTGVVTAVTEDFYANSMHSDSPPIVWFSIKTNNRYRFLSIRLKGGSPVEALTALESKWKQLLPDAPFTFQFMEDTVQNMYSMELKIQRASQVATIISLIIISLGIIGLTALSISLRIKEIGIRKVLGASMRNIVMLFSKEFYMTFFIAVLVGGPLVYAVMDRWLANYTLRAELNINVFILPLIGLVLLLLGIISTIVFQTIKSNPVDSLRDE